MPPFSSLASPCSLFSVPCSLLFGPVFFMHLGHFQSIVCQLSPGMLCSFVRALVSLLCFRTVLAGTVVCL